MLTVGTENFFRRVRFFAAAGVLLAGCGAPSEKFTPVTGRVTVNGSPLTTGAVTFHAHSQKGNSTPHVPVGTLDAQGNYKLMSATKEGAPSGWYKVTVSAQAPIDPQNPYAPPKHLISPKYSDANTSGLEIEVVATAPATAYDIKLAP